MFIEVERQTVVVTKYEIELNKNMVNAIVKALQERGEYEIGAFAEEGEFLEFLQENGFEATVFDIVNESGWGKKEEYFKGDEEYCLELVN